MRGWLCRRKWKIIVQDYICSPHAESMRKRNQIVFNMVEAETEYVKASHREGVAVIKSALVLSGFAVHDGHLTRWTLRTPQLLSEMFFKRNVMI